MFVCLFLKVSFSRSEYIAETWLKGGGRKANTCSVSIGRIRGSIPHSHPTAEVAQLTEFISTIISKHAEANLEGECT